MENLFENFTVTILKLNKLVQKIKHLEVSGYGLKTIHVMCVYYLYNNRNGLTLSELIKLTLEDKAAVSRAIKLLKEKGYAESNSSGYNYTVTLTEDGIKVAEAINDKADRAVSAASENFSEEERAEFYKRLNCIADKLQEYYDELKGDGND